MSDDAATKKNDRAKLLKKLRIAVIGLAAGLALGIGHVAHREVLLRAEELGLAPKICWRERQGAPSVPTVGTTCQGVIEAPSILVPTSLPPPPRLPEHVATERPRRSTVRDGRLVWID